jgi:hypothetical protein
MRSLCVAVGLALASANAMAADFGIGISARSDDGWLYVPIDVSKSFRIEPSVRYSSSDTSFTVNGGYEDSRDSNALELGVGLFGVKHIAEQAHLYYGGRLAYVDSESTTVQAGSFGGVIRGEGSSDGYRIGPTLGFEYIFGGHFSVGGEASYTYLELEGESTTRVGNGLSTSVSDSKQTSQGTQTQLIFRYMF